MLPHGSQKHISLIADSDSDSEAPPMLVPLSRSAIPVTLLTGCLGAGKTTLLSHLIKNAPPGYRLRCS